MNVPGYKTAPNDGYLIERRFGTTTMTDIRSATFPRISHKVLRRVYYYVEAVFITKFRRRTSKTIIVIRG